MTSGDQAGLQGTQPSRQACRKGMIRGGVTRTRQDRAVQQRMWGGSETCDERGWEGSHRHCSSTPPLPNKTWFHGSLPGLCLFPLRWFSSPTTSFPPSADPTALHTCDPHAHGRRPWTLVARRRPPAGGPEQARVPPASLLALCRAPLGNRGPRDECEHRPKKGTKLVSLPPGPHQNHILLPAHCLPGRQGFPCAESPNGPSGAAELGTTGSCERSGREQDEEAPVGEWNFGC